MKTVWAVLALIPSLAGAAAISDRFVWVFGFNLEDPADVAKVETLLTDGARHGINGAVVEADLDHLSAASTPFLDGLKRVSARCDAEHVELIPSVFSFGYGGPFLSVNRNLAEGLPVTGALFVAGRDGRAELVADPAVAIVNGDFETIKGDEFPGYDFTEKPGVVGFPDRSIRHGGAASLRLTNFAKDPHGHGRASQKIAVHPHRCYRVSLWLKADGLKPARCFNMFALAPVEGEVSLSQRSFDVPETTDWKRVTYLFNSLDYDTVTLYAGVWEAKAGTLWLDDWTIEEVGPVNVLRRPGTPVAVQGEDGAFYVEGRDYARLEDSGLHPWKDDRAALPLTLRRGGRIKPGTRLRVSWYHPMVTYKSQVVACMAEPEVYEIVQREAKVLWDTLHPRRVLLNMDEIRMGGTCAACRGRNPGELLGSSITRIVAILRSFNPGMQVYAWADMLDPNANATPGDYFLAKGGFAGAVDHVPQDLIMAVWGSDAEPKTFDFFAGKGFKMMGACYYDADDLKSVRGWLDQARRHPEVRGLMYTTWERKYDLLPAFANLLTAK